MKSRSEVAREAAIRAGRHNIATGGRPRYHVWIRPDGSRGRVRELELLLVIDPPARSAEAARQEVAAVLGVDPDAFDLELEPAPIAGTARAAWGS